MSRVRLSLKPGQPGTKSLLAKYGERLVCVRYRYDAQQRKRFKTVELIVDISEWRPGGDPVAGAELVSLRVDWRELELRRRVKAAGGDLGFGEPGLVAVHGACRGSGVGGTDRGQGYIE